MTRALELEVVLPIMARVVAAAVELVELVLPMFPPLLLVTVTMVAPLKNTS